MKSSRISLKTHIALPASLDVIGPKDLPGLVDAVDLIKPIEAVGLVEGPVKVQMPGMLRGRWM